MLLGFYIFLFSVQESILQQLPLDILKAQTLHCIGKTFPCYPLFAEQKDCFFHNGKHFLTICEDRIQITSLGHLLTPTAADVDAVSVCTMLNRLKRADSDAAAAVITGIPVNDDFSIVNPSHVDGTIFFYLTYLTAPAFFQIRERYSLADDSQIIEIRLHTVIGAASHSDLKFVRKLYLGITVIKPLMDFLRQAKGVDKADIDKWFPYRKPQGAP